MCVCDTDGPVMMRKKIYIKINLKKSDTFMTASVLKQDPNSNSNSVQNTSLSVAIISIFKHIYG